MRCLLCGGPASLEVAAATSRGLICHDCLLEGVDRPAPCARPADHALILHSSSGSLLQSTRPALRWLGEGSPCPVPECNALRAVVRVSPADLTGLDSPAEFRACGIEPDALTIAGAWRCEGSPCHEGEILLAEVLLEGEPCIPVEPLLLDPVPPPLLPLPLQQALLTLISQE